MWAVVWLGVYALACAHNTQRLNAPIVDHLRINGVARVDQGDLRAHLSTIERPRLPLIGIPSPFASLDDSRFDVTSYRRDLERIERYYQSQGYYNAAVTSAQVVPTADGHNVSIDIALREGPPTRIGSVWLSGCDPGSSLAGSQVTEPATCARIRHDIALRPGQMFTEAAFDADRDVITDLLKEGGHPTARVTSHATVDPLSHTAYVAFVLEPGPTGRFRDIRIVQGNDDASAANAHGRAQRTQYPLWPVQRVIHIHRGEGYTRTALSETQRLVFQLGVFGLVRIDEQPHRCDSHDRCDDARDPDDPFEHIEVDLVVRLTPANVSRVRFGVGLETDQIRSDVHATASYEYRNLFDTMARLRLEFRPTLYVPISLGTSGSSTFAPGGSLSAELRQPQIWSGGALVFAPSFEAGPDPINPNLASRFIIRAALGVQHRFNREVNASLFIRGTHVDYPENNALFYQDQQVQLDPILRALYVTATYAYLEAQISWDRRDNALAPHSGTFFQATAQFGPNLFQSYGFGRGVFEARGYIPLGRNFVIAMRGMIGAAFDVGGTVQGWPVPSELRFYSGGSNSNRGYPFNRVGYLSTVPLQSCMLPNGSAGGPYECNVPRTSPPYSIATDSNGNAQPDLRRLAPIGGLAAWEASIEFRYYFRPWGLVLFFDTSDVSGWRPPSQLPMRPATLNTVVAGPSPPDPSLGNAYFPINPHPSAGIGVRYSTPIGIIRLDLGLRLSDLSCTGFKNEVAAQNAQTGNAPYYYAVSQPNCDAFGVPIPLAINFGIGEAY